MNPYFQHHLITFDRMAAPVVYVVADEDYQASAWQLALNIRADSASEQRDAGLYMRLFDNESGRFCMDARVNAEFKKQLYSSRLNAHIVVLKVRDTQALKKRLKERLATNMPASLQREKELTSPVLNPEKISRHTSVVDKFTRLNPDFVTDALSHHWLHLLTGLVLVEGDKLLLEAGNIPLWARDIITEVLVAPLAIRQSE
ncbi:MAG: hypothetical protein RSD49_01545 [Hafnia sp.]